MDELVFRKLEQKDRENYLLLLSQLSPVESIDEIHFQKLLDQIELNGHIYVYEIGGNIIGSGKLLVEQKLSRGGSKVGHLEDVVIDNNYRGLRIGKKLVENIIDLAKKEGCYKIVGECNEDVIGFYEKIGFEKKGFQIAIYF